MPGAVCKAAICANEAQGRMNAAYDHIESLRNEKPEIQIIVSEMYIKALKECADKAIVITA